MSKKIKLYWCLINLNLSIRKRKTVQIMQVEAIGLQYEIYMSL